MTGLKIFLYVALFVLIAINFYYSVKSKIRSTSQKAINTAEKSDKSGKEKMEIAIAEVKKIIPWLIKFLFPDKIVSDIIQDVFDGMEEYALTQTKKGGNSDGD
jgi:type IV secretory pathway TrbL component